MVIRKVDYIIVLILIVFPVFSQERKVQNQPYADHKLYHWGFHVGLHSQDLLLTNTGIASPDGTVLFAEIPNYSPGFSVGVIGDLFLNPYMNLRFTPTIHFGDRLLFFKDMENNEETRVSVRSNYMTLPLDLKISAMRVNNYRPYVIGGVYGALDLGRKKGYPLLMKQLDYGFEFGFGCNIYMPFFKLAPEIKFQFGLPDIMEHDRPDLLSEEDKIFTNALSKATTRMVVITFNFE
ncbi:MAG: PorT family protein, partial [Tannerella sp.]|nr:PorT family protein [Tannerella sp.]